LRISIGSHPDQFNVLASNNKDAVRRTINELNFQASVLDQLGLPQDHSAPMNIHINYTPQADETLEIVATRFFRNLSMCDKGVYKRLTIENEDKGFFNVDNCIKFSDHLYNTFGAQIPVCYDNLHDFCNPSEERNITFQAERCAYTWVNTDKPHDDECEAVADYFAPVFHWSEGKPEKPRAHADYFALGNTPPHIAIDVDRPAKWECEVKGKDKAIRLLQKALA
jgi:UV DNA damage repair endonuclease